MTNRLVGQLMAGAGTIGALYYGKLSINIFNFVAELGTSHPLANGLIDACSYNLITKVAPSLIIAVAGVVIISTNKK